MTTWSPRLSLPARWPRWSDPGNGILVHATSPDGRSEHLASITLLLEPPSGPSDLVGGESSHVLEDENLREIDGGTGVGSYLHRRWSLRLAGVELIRDEWRWPGHGPPAVLRCTATPYNYEPLIEVFAAVAASVRFEPSAASLRDFER